MSSLNNSIKILARRFVSLPPHVRVEIASRLLRWREENPSALNAGTQSLRGCEHDKSFLEQFWDEVETAHGDDLYLTNPFAESGASPMLYVINHHSRSGLAYL
jgi:hypothetical protein